ncbi:Heat shock protein 12B [Blyttiomyces sp. JEL0837]|nr:Heat shock protein 12B [Blyttiomyces sp. JEL0837]
MVRLDKQSRRGRGRGRGPGDRYRPDYTTETAPRRRSRDRHHPTDPKNEQRTNHDHEDDESRPLNQSRSQSPPTPTHNLRNDTARLSQSPRRTLSKVKVEDDEVVGDLPLNRKRKLGHDERDKDGESARGRFEGVVHAVKDEVDVGDSALFADQLNPAAKHKNSYAVFIAPWPHTSGGKTATAALFEKSTKELVSFGTAAVEKYANLKVKDRQNFLFFQHFKMALYSEKTVNEETLLFDEEVVGGSMKAVDVIAGCLKVLKEAAVTEIKGKSSTDILETDILWVLTVPAIWKEDAKRLMRLSAIQAGLTTPDRNSSLLLVLEPEAASIHCLMEDRDAFNEGDVYIVADCGGGTVDCSVHQVVDKMETTVKEAIAASGSNWGSRVIDQAFFDMLDALCGKETVAEFRKLRGPEWLKVTEEWERRKCAYDGKEDSDVLVMLPPTLAQIAGQELDNFNSSGRGIRYGILEMDGDRIVLSHNVMNNLSRGSITKTVDHISTILDRVPEAKRILLMGNFANSPALQLAFRENFENKCSVRVVVPTRPGECVVRGAVILGNRPRNITERRSQFSYGVQIRRKFIEGVHNPTKKVRVDGTDRAEDVASWMIRFGEAVPFGKTVEKTFFPSRKGQRGIQFFVFEGRGRDGIEYVSDPDCRRLGAIESGDVDPDALDTHGVKFTMLFGNSEILATTKDPFGVVTSASIQYK